MFGESRCNQHNDTTTKIFFCCFILYNFKNFSSVCLVLLLLMAYKCNHHYNFCWQHNNDVVPFSTNAPSTDWLFSDNKCACTSDKYVQHRTNNMLLLFSFWGWFFCLLLWITYRNDSKKKKNRKLSFTKDIRI